MKQIKHNEENYKEFDRSEEAFEWGRKHFDISKLNKEEIQLLSFYTGSEYKILNELLRLGTYETVMNCNPGDYKEYIDEIKSLNRIINKFSIDENVIVYRYTNFRSIRKLLKNKELVVSQFYSTTLVKDLLLDFAHRSGYRTLLRIYVPKGTKCIYFDDSYVDGSVLDEKEVILPSNTKYRVIKKKLFGIINYIELEVTDQYDTV